MKKFLIILTLLATATLFAGCNDPAPTAVLEPEGTEDIIVEDIIIEDITTWDNVPTQTWD